MKDTIITSKMKKRELVTFLICFASAYLLNVIGIIAYKSPAKELVTELHVVFLVAAVIYIAVLILRLLYYSISRLWITLRK